MEPDTPVIYPIYIKYNKKLKAHCLVSRDPQFSPAEHQLYLNGLLADIRNLKKQENKCCFSASAPTIKTAKVNQIFSVHSSELNSKYLFINRIPPQPRMAYKSILFELVPLAKQDSDDKARFSLDFLRELPDEDYSLVKQQHNGDDVYSLVKLKKLDGPEEGIPIFTLASKEPA